MRGSGALARFGRSRAATMGAAVVAALVLFAIVAPIVSRHGPLESNFDGGIGPDNMPVGPCAAFPLGVDRIFRDELTRLAVAGRLSLAIACAATTIATAIGALVGIVAGYYEGARVRLPWPVVGGVAAGAAAVLLGHAWLGAAAVVCGAALTRGAPFGLSARLRRDLTRGAPFGLSARLRRDLTRGAPFGLSARLRRDLTRGAPFGLSARLRRDLTRGAPFGLSARLRRDLRRGRSGRGVLLDVDGLLMRMVDVLLAFPFLLLVMAIGASLDRTSAGTILLTLGATGWLGIARVLRAKTMQIRTLDYIVASRALGQSTPRVLFKHVLPNVAGLVIVSATVLVAQMIVADSALSYLGVGIAPPTPTWGRMLFEGQSAIQTSPWLVAAPGAIIVSAVWGFNMLGEGLRDALDPRQG